MSLPLRSGSGYAESVVSHLVGGLSPPASKLWDSGFDSFEPTPIWGLHDEIHARLGPLVRELCSSAPGIAMHAGACGLGRGRGLLLPGGSKAGKSTLVTALAIHREAHVVGDDVVLVGANGVEGIGAPLAIRRNSPFWPCARDLWFADDSERVLVRPEDLGCAEMSYSTTIDVVVFPQMTPDSVGLEALSAPATFCRLMGSLMRKVTALEVLVVARMATDCPGYSMTYSDVQTSLRLCDEALADTMQPIDLKPGLLEPPELEGLSDDVVGIRFGDDVVLLIPSSREVVHLREWEPGHVLSTTARQQLRQRFALEKQ